MMKTPSGGKLMMMYSSRSLSTTCAATILRTTDWPRHDDKGIGLILCNSIVQVRWIWIIVTSDYLAHQAGDDTAEMQIQCCVPDMTSMM